MVSFDIHYMKLIPKGSLKLRLTFDISGLVYDTIMDVHAS